MRGGPRADRPCDHPGLINPGDPRVHASQQSSAGNGLYNSAREHDSSTSSYPPLAMDTYPHRPRRHRRSPPSVMADKPLSNLSPSPELRKHLLASKPRCIRAYHSMQRTETHAGRREQRTAVVRQSPIRGLGCPSVSRLVGPGASLGIAR